MSLPAVPSSPVALLRAAGLHPKRHWGQNFLCDQSVLRRIAQATQAPAGATVVELGAGLGALTYHLLKRGQRVIAVERDRDVVPHLQAYLPTAEVLQADAGRLDYAALAGLHGPLRVVGNLPYQLSSRILVGLADARGAVAQAVLLVQREVAQRLCAKAPNRECGLLTVLVQRTFDVEPLFDVPPGAFYPAPKVHSSVVRLHCRPSLCDASTDAHRVAAARAAFSARRKTLRNALAGGFKLAPAAAEALALAAHIDPQARAETLTLDDFTRLGAAAAAAGFVVSPASADSEAAP